MKSTQCPSSKWKNARGTGKPTKRNSGDTWYSKRKANQVPALAPSARRTAKTSHKVVPAFVWRKRRTVATTPQALSASKTTARMKASIRVLFRRTPELTGAGGHWRPNWKLTWPARVRSSDWFGDQRFHIMLLHPARMQTRDTQRCRPAATVCVLPAPRQRSGQRQDAEESLRR